MTAEASPAGWDAIVVAGGASRRMGGPDKLTLEVAGRPMLDRVLAAVARAGRVIVVGPRRETVGRVTWCMEEPPGGGPAAAIRAGLDQAGAAVVVVLAGDQPLVDERAVQQLVDAIRRDGAVAVDASGRPQWLCSAWRADALRAAPLVANASLHAALGVLAWDGLVLDSRAALDCDTPEDLRRARELAQ